MRETKSGCAVLMWMMLLCSMDRRSLPSLVRGISMNLGDFVRGGKGGTVQVGKASRILLCECWGAWRGQTGSQAKLQRHTSVRESVVLRRAQGVARYLWLGIRILGEHGEGLERGEERGVRWRLAGAGAGAGDMRAKHINFT